MELRGRLLVSFITIILVVLIAFGLFAYQIADQSAIEKEKVLLTSIVDREADMLSKLYQDGHDLQQLRDHLGNRKAANHYPLVADMGGSSNMIQQLQSNLGELTPQLPLQEFLDTEIMLGNTKIENGLYIWNKTTIPNTPYTLLHIYRSEQTISKPLAGLAARLITTGLFILWVAVWVALIISTTVTRRLHEQTKALKYQSLHDGLTDLPNRILMQQHLQNAVDEAKRKHKSVALIMMDLDRFKEINNTLGHHIGDRLLQEIGKRLHETLRDSDTVARLGGDEFALLLPMADASHCVLVINKVMQAIDQPFHAEGIALDVEASLGVALYPDHGEDAITLMSRADVAMYQAKHGGSGYSFYDGDNDPHSVQRLTLMAELRHAMEHDDLLLHYQPKIDLRQGKTLGVEALLRWQHPKHGMIPPNDFIPLAEQTGLMKPLTLWVLHKAISQCARWHKAGLAISVSVNISARILHDLQLPNQIEAMLKYEQLGAEWLELEITETAIMMDPARAQEMLNLLDAMGARLSIDDFGTGYTSLAYLKQLPMDEIKIDKSFVLNMLQDNENAIIVRSIIDLAHNMGRSVVAEGIEDDATLQALKQLSCDIGQGFHMSRPIAAEQLEQWLQQSDWGFTHPAQQLPEKKLESGQ